MTEFLQTVIQHQSCISHIPWETHPKGKHFPFDTFISRSLSFTEHPVRTVPSCGCYHFSGFADHILHGNILLELCRTPTPAPVSLGHTEFTEKKGTKMKLLKQHQPQVTELLLPNTNTLCLSKHFQHMSQGHRGVKSPEPVGRTSTTLISNKSTQLNWMVQLRLDLEASGKAIGTQAQQHRIHFVTSEMGGSVWDTLCIQLQQCHSSTAALKNFCF